KISSLL
ncbi:hypothetical protein BVZ79_01204B, partial [Haemophilus influenzae]